MQMNDSDKTPGSWRAVLRRSMDVAFNDDEIANICFDLAVQYENLKGESKSAKIRELIEFAERTGILLRLIEACKAERKNQPWDELRQIIEKELRLSGSTEGTMVEGQPDPSARVVARTPATRPTATREVDLATEFATQESPDAAKSQAEVSLRSRVLTRVWPYRVWAMAVLFVLVGAPVVNGIIRNLEAEEVARVCPPAGPRWGTTLYNKHKARLGCPFSQEIATLAAFQLYEMGLMVWRQDLNRVYALYDKGTFDTLDGADVPIGYFRSPIIKGAFGYFWNTNSSVEQALGQPIAVEMHATNFAVQDFEKGVIFYFVENEARNYVLFADNNTWESQQE